MTPQEYVASVALPQHSPGLIRLALDSVGSTPTLADAPSGYINDGSLTSFVAGVDASTQADVLNSTLFAQAAASAAFDRNSDTINWYNSYSTGLANLGWVTQDFSFENMSTGGSEVSVDKAVLAVLASIASEDELAVVQALMDGMKSLDQGDGRLTLWESSSHTSDKGNFQLFPVSVSGSVPIMKLAAFYFTTTVTVDRILWFSASSSNSSFFKGTQTVNLDLSVYSQVRDQVITRLGDHAKVWIQNVPLKF